MEEIEVRQKEEEMRAQEAETKYNRIHKQFTEAFNKEITEKYIDALRNTMHVDSSQTPIEFYADALNEMLAIETNVHEMLKFAITENKLALGKAIVKFDRTQDDSTQNRISINKPDKGGSTLFIRLAGTVIFDL